MGSGVDVYQLIKVFVQRNGPGAVEYHSFAQAVQRQAKLGDQSQPHIRDLANNPDVILVPKLLQLAREKKLHLEMSGNEIGSILLPQRYEEVYKAEFKRIDENPEVPFPDEDSLKSPVPPEWIREISIESDLETLSEAAGEESAPLYRLTFPDNVKAFVLPSAYVPEKLLEYAVVKLRQYMRKGANREFLQKKLLYAFPGKEGQARDTVDSILTKPHEAVEDLRKCQSDFIYPFWSYLNGAIKKDLDKKSDKTAEDWSVIQSAYVCDFFSNYYRAKAQRQLDTEAAYKALDQALRKSPFHFTIAEITSIRDSKGVLLLGRYSQEQLEARLREMTTKTNQGFLPDILVLPEGSHSSYVPKEKAILLAVKLLGEARAEIRSRLIDTWGKLLREFRSVPAMESDDKFRSELEAMVAERAPLLHSLVSNRLLPLVYEELASAGEPPQGVEQLFVKGELIALDELLQLTRKDLLADSRMLLPFWYTIPVLSFFARLLRKRGEKKGEPASREAPRLKTEAPSRPAEAQAHPATTVQQATKVMGGGGGKPAKVIESAASRKAEFAAAATQVAKSLVPKGQSLDDYLAQVAGRWNTMLNPEAKKNLNEDVNSLVRDYLRRTMRTMRGTAINPKRVQSLAQTLAESPSLEKIKENRALELYIQLYMTKLLGAVVRKE
jgi:hypothetical protein